MSTGIGASIMLLQPLLHWLDAPTPQNTIADPFVVKQSATAEGQRSLLAYGPQVAPDRTLAVAVVTRLLSAASNLPGATGVAEQKKQLIQRIVNGKSS